MFQSILNTKSKEYIRIEKQIIRIERIFFKNLVQLKLLPTELHAYLVPQN